MILNLALVTYATKTACWHLTVKDLSSSLIRHPFSKAMVVDLSL